MNFEKLLILLDSFDGGGVPSSQAGAMSAGNTTGTNPVFGNYTSQTANNQNIYGGDDSRTPSKLTTYTRNTSTGVLTTSADLSGTSLSGSIDNLSEEKISPEDLKELHDKWKSLVNMSASELQKFYDSPEGKEAGLSRKEAKDKGIRSGRDSALAIIKMKNKNYKDWSPSEIQWAKHQISFVSRMKGAKGPLYDDKGNKTRKHLSLLIWGYNPEKGK